MAASFITSEADSRSGFNRIVERRAPIYFLPQTAEEAFVARAKALEDRKRLFKAAIAHHRELVNRLRDSSPQVDLHGYVQVSRECAAALRECILLQRRNSSIYSSEPLEARGSHGPTEEERQYLSRELHDDFGQRLALLGLQINSAIDALPASSLLLNEIREGIETLGARVRTFAHALYPCSVEELGLIPSLRGLVGGLQHAGVEISIATPMECALSSRNALALYRVAQEAVQNALKHAPGAPVHITLARDSGWELVVRDAGPGFPPSTDSRGAGISNMDQRMRSVGGTFSITSCGDHGTTVVAYLPE